MKKIALLLALLLCLAPVLSACGVGGGGGVKAVKKYLDAFYVDFDEDAFDEVYLLCNEDLVEENLSDELLEEYKENDIAQMYHNQIDEMADLIEGAKKYSFDYEIYDSRNIKEDDDEFDAIMEEIEFKDTDFEDITEEFCLVRVVGTFTFVNDDKEERIEDFYNTILAGKIDGKWYVLTNREFDTAYEKNDENADIEEWL